ncbi:MAG: hypothetical protein IJZ42_13615 [Lachnospiraceae bacterium]|nr:hypothetical protein [Lachnospiraceae bacterium]
MDKLYEVGNGPIWNVGGTTTNPDEGGSGTGDEDSVLGLRRFKEYNTLEEFQNCLDTFPSNLTLEDENELLSDGDDYFIIFPTYASANDTAYTIAKQSFVTQEFTFLGRYDISGTDGEITVDWSNNKTFEITKASSNEDYNAWLLANTEPVESSGEGTTEEESYVIEAGTYRFNDVLELSDLILDAEYYIEFLCNTTWGGELLINKIVVSYSGSAERLDVHSPTEGYFDIYDTNNGWQAYVSKDVIISNDIDTNSIVANWFIANTKRVIEVDELPTEDIDTGAIYKVNELVEDTDTSTIAGTWVFNETIDPEAFGANKTFYLTYYYTTSTEIECSDMALRYYSDGPGKLYYMSASGTGYYAYGNKNDNVWESQTYRTITITSATSTNYDGDDITAEFLAWLKANATKQPEYKTVEKYYQYVDGAWVEQ